MKKITRLAVNGDGLTILLFVLLELSGLGPIARSRTDEGYNAIRQIGAPWFLLVLYVIFGLILPLVNLMAIAGGRIDDIRQVYTAHCRRKRAGSTRVKRPRRHRRKLVYGS